jgi:hypothetical protein
MKLLKTPFLRKFVSKFVKDESGQSVAVILISIGSVMALSASGIETGHVYYAYRMLQSSTNAATLAAAQAMPDIGTQKAATAGTAWGNLIDYSSETGEKNANPILTNDSITASFYCSSTVSGSLNVSCQSPPSGEGSCTSGSTCNALKVTQTAQVNLWFGGFVGVRTFNLSATSTAAMRGGTDIPYNIAVIIDTTESMTAKAASGDGCGSNATQITCAVTGLETLLEKMDPCPLNVTCSASGAYVDDVSLFVFPAIKEGPVTGSSPDPNEYVSDDTSCPTSNPTTVPYGFENATSGTTQNLYLPWNTSTASATYGSSDAGTYQVVTFNNTYKSSDGMTTLQSGNALAATVGVGSTGCKGLQAPGGQGTYYAQVIRAAQAALVTQQAANPGSQNILIILSDGDASACSVQAYSTGDGSVCGSGKSSQIVAWNCQNNNTGGSGCTGSALNGTCPTSTTCTSNPGYNSPNYPSELGQCGQAVEAAQLATQAGTTVYTVAMGSETSGGCTTDAKYTNSYGSTYGAEAWPSGTYSGQPCNAIASMASNPNTFYSDNTGGCAATNNSAFTTMSSIFQAIGNGLTSARLIPNGTT